MALVKKHWEGAAYTLLMLVLMAPMVFVFFWMVSLSFRTNVEATASPPVFIPRNPTLMGYQFVFNNPSNPFFKYLLNSTIVALGCTAIGLLIGVPAAFSIARWKQNGLALGILLARITPGLSFLVPWFITFRWFGLIDTHAALIISHLIVGLPIIVWVMIGYFEGVPKELEDAARVDGASIWQSFRYIALPLARPGIVVGAILAFIFSWNNFIFSVVLGGKNTRTLPSAVYNMLTFEQLAWGPLAAAALLVTLPVLLVTAFAQREIIAGLSSGGLKDG